MARFDIFKTATNSYVVDCQADFLDHLTTRFVIPLFPPDIEPKNAVRLNPVFLVNDAPHVLYPQFAASIAVTDLKERIASLADHHTQILDALDMLTSGY